MAFFTGVWSGFKSLEISSLINIGVFVGRRKTRKSLNGHLRYFSINWRGLSRLRNSQNSSQINRSSLWHPQQFPRYGNRHFALFETAICGFLKGLRTFVKPSQINSNILFSENIPLISFSISFCKAPEQVKRP
jgi:hypothetical protein